MTEATQSGAAQAAPQSITTTQAAQMLAERRAAAATPNTSEAARILGQRAAQARQERQAQAAQTEETPQESGNTEDESNPMGDTPGDETADAEQPNETESQPENEPAEQTIELEPGLKVTLDDVRNGFMLKADHTRKTQALAEERKALEAERTQRLTQLDKLIASIEPLAGDNKPKTLRDFVHEHGAEEGLIQFHEHQKRVEAAKRLAHETRTRAQQEARVKAEQDCDQYLVENHNKEWADPRKYEAAQVEITKYAKSLGFSNDEIYALGVMPGAIIALDKARQYDALNSKQGEVKKTIAAKPAVFRPGAKVSAQAGAQSAAQSAKAALKSSGSVADAVKYLQAQRKTRG